MGVPHDSVKGPLLFSLYIHDLPGVCNRCDVQMCADDTVIYVHAKYTEEAALQLTFTMTNVTKWLADSCLHLNVKKTVCSYKRGLAKCYRSQMFMLHVKGYR